MKNNIIKINEISTTSVVDILREPFTLNLLNKFHGSTKTSVWSISGDNNKITITVNTPMVYRTKDYYKEHKTKFYNRLKDIKNNASLNNYEKIKAYKYATIQEKFSMKDIGYGNAKSVERCYTDTKKLIFKSQTEIYYVHNKTVRRVKANSKTFKSIMNSFVTTIMHDVHHYNTPKSLDIVLRCFYKNYSIVSNIGIAYVYDILRIADKLGDLQIPKFVKKCEDLDVLDKYINVHNIGIKDVNAIKVLLNNRCFCEVKHCKVYYKALKKYYIGTNVNADMVFANRLTSDYQLSYDAVNMYYMAIRHRTHHKDKNLIPLRKDILKLSLKDMHDYLAKVLRNDIAIINYREYKDSDYDFFEKEIDGYKFILPRNSVEVTRMADIFQNCVAGYAPRISKDEIIMYATNNQDIINYIQNDIGDYIQIRKNIGDEPACIEIRKNHRTMFEGFSQEEIDAYPKYEVIQNYTLNNRTPDEKLEHVTHKYFDSIQARSHYYKLPF